jgi:predicted nucleotide-binding protein
MQDPKKVFIVYGRNSDAHNAMRLFLRALELSPLDFDEVRNRLGGSPFVGDIVQSGMGQARAIIVMLTPDELSTLHPKFVTTHDSEHDKRRWQSRPNVLLEAGMALALDEKRTILVTLGPVQLPSDLHGRHHIRLDNSDTARDRLKTALEGAGCITGKHIPDWRNPKLAGDFESSLPALPEVSAISPF